MPKTDKIPKKPKQNLVDIHREAMENFQKAFSKERDQREKCQQDMRFCLKEGSQWESDVITKRGSRPRFEINKIQTATNQVQADQRQQSFDPKVRPVSGGADEKLAETFNGLIRNIMNISKFDNVKAESFKESSVGGIGGWTINTELPDDSFDEQDIRIKVVNSACSSIYFDTSSTDLQHRDAKWAFIAEYISLEEFNARYPGKGASNLPTLYNDLYSSWAKDNRVRIADYWRKEPVIRRLGLMSDGRVLDLEDEKDVLDELAKAGVTIRKEREVSSFKVVHYRVSGSDILSGPNEWAGKFIPIVPLYGYQFWTNGLHFYRGMVRLAKDAQRLYNYSVSAIIETANAAAKDPIVVSPKMIEGKAGRRLEKWNEGNDPFLLLNPDPLMPAGPKRLGPPSVQGALINSLQQADADIQATTGKFAPSLGDNPKDQSGVAILAQQRQGDAGTFELVDNLRSSVEFTGEILVDLLPKIYDTKRQVRILKPDDTTEMVMINDTMIDEQTGKEVNVNNLQQGKYDVTVDVGPSYNTQRIETVNALTALSQNSDQFALVSGDIIAKNLDFPGSQEITDRMRKILIDQGIITPTEEEEKELGVDQPPEPTMQDKIVLEGAKLDLERKAVEIDKIEAETNIKRLEVKKLAAETTNEGIDTIGKAASVDKTMAETDKIRSETAGQITEDLGLDQQLAGSFQPTVAPPPPQPQAPQQPLQQQLPPPPVQ